MLDKKAKAGVCMSCFGFVWNAQWCGFKVEADPIPVDILTEARCLYNKRPTYGVSRWRPGFYLERRSIRNIAKQYEFVLAKHQCRSEQSSRKEPDYWNEQTAVSSDTPNF
jgi:hypothetical protein